MRRQDVQGEAGGSPHTTDVFLHALRLALVPVRFTVINWEALVDAILSFVLLLARSVIITGKIFVLLLSLRPLAVLEVTIVHPRHAGIV